jgi:hypothetical protein
MGKYIMFLSCLACVVSCSENKVQENKKDFSISNVHYGYQIELKEKIICKGDIQAYQKLIDIYSDDWNLEDMLSYSIIMANKYHYSEAYYYVFKILTSLPNINANICVEDRCVDNGLYCLDDKTREMAISYFKNAIYNGSILASDELLNFYSKGKEYPVKELYEDTLLIKRAKENLKR